MQSTFKMLIGGVQFSEAHIGLRILPGIRLLELADFVTDIAAGIFTIPQLESPFLELTATSLGMTFFLFGFQGYLTGRDSRQRRVKRLVSLAGGFFEDAIMWPINIYHFWNGYKVGDKPNPHQVNELTILAISVAVGATVGVIKVTSIIYDSLWQDKVFEGDYDSLLDFLKKENRVQAKFLLPHFICGTWCRKRRDLDLGNTRTVGPNSS